MREVFSDNLKWGGSLGERPSCENRPGDGPWEQGRAVGSWFQASRPSPLFYKLGSSLPSPRWLSPPHLTGDCWAVLSSCILRANRGHGHPGHQSAHPSLGVIDLSLSCVALFFVFNKHLILEHLNSQKSCIHPFIFKVPNRSMWSIFIVFSSSF